MREDLAFIRSVTSVRVVERKCDNKGYTQGLRSDSLSMVSGDKCKKKKGEHEREEIDRADHAEVGDVDSCNAS